MINNVDTAKRCSAILVLLSHNRDVAVSLNEDQLSDVITFASLKKTGTNLVRKPLNQVVEFLKEAESYSRYQAASMKRVKKESVTIDLA